MRILQDAFELIVVHLRQNTKMMNIGIRDTEDVKGTLLTLELIQSEDGNWKEHM